MRRHNDDRNFARLQAHLYVEGQDDCVKHEKPNKCGSHGLENRGLCIFVISLFIIPNKSSCDYGHARSSVGKVSDLRTGGRLSDPRLG